MTTKQTIPFEAEVASDIKIRTHLIKLLTTMDVLIHMRQVTEPIAIERFRAAAAAFPHLNFMSIRHDHR